MSQASSGYRIFASIFLILFAAGTIAHTLIVREETKRAQIIELRHLASQLPKPTSTATLNDADARAFFELVESRSSRPAALLLFSSNTPLLFWGDQTLTAGSGDVVRLSESNLQYERIEYLAGPNLRLSALYTVFGETQTFYVARLAVFVLLGFAVLSVIIQIAIRRPRGNQAGAADNTAGNSSPAVADSTPAATVNADNADTAVASAQRAASPRAGSPDAAEPSIQAQLPNPSADNIPSEAEPQQPTHGDLVYPKTQLNERLASELHRAGSNQTDISLGLIAAAKFVAEPEFHALLREHFVYRDVLFREGKNLCWVLLPQVDLDSAMKELEMFIAFSRKRLGDKPEAGKKQPAVIAGLSSRNGRLVGPTTLYKECKSALRKATTDAALVGFRTDPEKYRNYVLKNRGRG